MKLTAARAAGVVAKGAAFALLTVVFAACGGQTADANEVADADAAAPEPRTGREVYVLSPATIARHGIAAAPATIRVLQPRFPAPGRVVFATDRVVRVSSPLAGRVVSVHATEGLVVEPGAPLVVLECPELGAARGELLVKSSDASAAAAKVAWTLEEWDRGKALFEESNGVSNSELRRREVEYQSALSASRAAEVEVQAARARLRLLAGDDAAAFEPSLVEAGVRGGAPTVTAAELGSTITLRAPAAGQVIARSASPGQRVGPDTGPLLTLADPSVLWVLADAPEGHAGDVRVGSRAEIRVSSRPDQVVDGTVVAVSPVLDPATRTAAVRIEVAAEAGLRPGMFAEVRLEIFGDGDHRVLSVAEESIQTVDGESVVFVPASEVSNAFSMRPVTVGRAVDGFVPVLSGLTEGERVVAHGSFIIKAQATQVGPADAGVGDAAAPSVDDPGQEQAKQGARKP